jgi:hypothetical protein
MNDDLVSHNDNIIDFQNDMRITATDFRDVLIWYSGLSDGFRSCFDFTTETDIDFFL